MSGHWVLCSSGFSFSVSLRDIRVRRRGHSDRDSAARQPRHPGLVWAEHLALLRLPQVGAGAELRLGVCHVGLWVFSEARRALYAECAIWFQEWGQRHRMPSVPFFEKFSGKNKIVAGRSAAALRSRKEREEFVASGIMRKAARRRNFGAAGPHPWKHWAVSRAPALKCCPGTLSQELWNLGTPAFVRCSLLDCHVSSRLGRGRGSEGGRDRGFCREEKEWGGGV